MKTTDGRLVLAEDRRSPRRRGAGRALVVLLVAVVALAALAGYQSLTRSAFSATCRVTAAGTTFTFTPEQTGNAALIAAISTKRGLAPRAATIALATAIQESKLRNVDYGDRDSVGLFQQRPSQGWGTRAQILDPAYSANTFFDALVKVKGYETRDITEVAQEVQRSGFPEAYADHEQEARVLASALTGHSPAGLGCRLRPVERAVDAATVATDLAAHFGARPSQDGAQLTVTGASPEQAWATGHWAVARAELYGIDRVQVGDRLWARSEDEDASGWSAAGPGSGPTAVTIRIGMPGG